VPAAQGLPGRDPLRKTLRQRQRDRIARLHVQRIRYRRPHILPGKHVAIGDVERLVARGIGLAGPGDRARQKVDIDRLRHPRRTAGIVERPALFAQHGGIDAERRDQIHGAAHRETDDQDRPQNAPVPGLALLQLAQASAFRRYRRGDLLLPAGAPATDAFLVIAGQLAVTVPTGEGDIRLELVPPGEIMVLQEMLAGGSSPVRVAADLDTDVLAIGAQALVDAMERNWVVERNISAVTEARRQAILPLNRGLRVVA